MAKDLSFRSESVIGLILERGWKSLRKDCAVRRIEANICEVADRQQHSDALNLLKQFYTIREGPARATLASAQQYRSTLKQTGVFPETPG